MDFKANRTGRTGRRFHYERGQGIFMLRIAGITWLHILDERLQRPLFSARFRITHRKIGYYYVSKFFKLNRFFHGTPR